MSGAQEGMGTGVLGFIILFPLFMAAVVIHEVSHGWVAHFFGDPTASLAGRLSLNPLKHMDPVGTFLLPLMLVLVRAPFVFGWAKPVPINPLYLRHPKRDMLWVGAAGPAANFLIAAAGSLLIKTGLGFFPTTLIAFLRTFVLINLVLGTFNLIPIPPLDGSRVLVGLLPRTLARSILALERWGIVLVMLLLALGFFDRFLWRTVGFLGNLLGL